MSLGKILSITAGILFVLIFAAVLFKGSDESYQVDAKPVAIKAGSSKPIEVELDQGTTVAAPAKPRTIQPAQVAAVVPPLPVPAPPPVKESAAETLAPVEQPVAKSEPEPAPEPATVDRIEELFSTKGPKLPIVETISYKSRVPWQKGRPAWLSDYAQHYDTSRHFIARSLNGKADYFKQDIAEGAKFNILRKDVPFEFRLVIDTSRCKMWFFYVDTASNEKVLLKTYPVSLGRPDSSKTSGILTPLGKYTLGSRVAVYKPKVMGHHKGQKIEMIRVFGTRWIPFDKEVGETTAPAKGFGIHGVPWVDKGNDKLAEDLSSLGKYESDGCVRMSTDAVEEIFAIIITKPTTIELVKDIAQSELYKK